LCDNDAPASRSFNFDRDGLGETGPKDGELGLELELALEPPPPPRERRDVRAEIRDFDDFMVFASSADEELESASVTGDEIMAVAGIDFDTMRSGSLDAESVLRADVETFGRRRTDEVAELMASSMSL
jgi:hypothetical protein